VQCGQCAITLTATVLRAAKAGFGADEKHPVWAQWERTFIALNSNSDAVLPSIDAHG
jgi:hypothetical protein